ncbi:hypothetical protein UK82_17825 [Frankia sp. ACN1ag]|nr:hypothetical protein UK82_17825 [Frankia sp. ACN1ag]
MTGRAPARCLAGPVPVTAPVSGAVDQPDAPGRSARPPEAAARSERSAGHRRVARTTLAAPNPPAVRAASFSFVARPVFVAWPAEVAWPAGVARPAEVAWPAGVGLVADAAPAARVDCPARCGRAGLRAERTDEPSERRDERRNVSATEPASPSEARAA